MAKMKCKFCGYEWITASKLIMVSCPSCMKKNNNLNLEDIKDGKPIEMVDLEIPEQDSRFTAKIHDNVNTKEELNGEQSPDALNSENGD